MQRIGRFRPLMAAGMLLLLPGRSQAGGHLCFSHPCSHFHSTSQTSFSAAPGVFTQSAAPMTFGTFSAAPATFTSFSAAPMTFSAAPVTFSAAPMTFSAAPVSFSAAPAVSFSAAPGFSLPAASTAGSTAFSAAPSSQAPLAFSAAAFSAASAHAGAADENSAIAAEGEFPRLAQAARNQNFNGGRFILALKKLLQLGAADLAGQPGAASNGRSILRDALMTAVRVSLKSDPVLAGLAPEIEALLGTFLGGGQGGGGGALTPSTSADGRCITIKICLDGGATVVDDGTGKGQKFAPAPAPAAGGDPKVIGAAGALNPPAGAILPAAAPPPPAAPQDVKGAVTNAELQSQIDGLRKLIEERIPPVAKEKKE